MSYKVSDEERKDALDLMLEAVREHEKKLDAILERMENVARKMEMLQP